MADLRVSTLDGDEAILSEKVVEGFKAKLSGELILPGDGNYETARRVWNGDIDRKPALIAQCTGCSRRY